MSRLEELLLKWHDRSISKAELEELNAALKDPACRLELIDSFALDNQLIEALQSAKSVAHAAASAQAFPTVEVRRANAFESVAEIEVTRFNSLRKKLQNLTNAIAKVGRPVWMRLLAAGAAVVIIAASAMVLSSARVVAVIEGNGTGVIVQRGSEVIPARQGLSLKLGDRVKTSGDYSVWVRYLNEPTQIRVQAGSQLTIDQDAAGKRLELLFGSVTAKVAPQPAGHPMFITTPQSEAKVLGTEFLLVVETSSTRLEVIDGAVQLSNREDGRAVAVHRDQFATVAKGVELAARPLLPAPWNSQDVGAVGLTGYARIEGHRCKIKGAGKPDAKSKDQFHFLYQSIEGDGEIQVRVVDVELTHKLAKAGVLIRDNLKPNSPHAFLYLRAGSGVEFQHRAQSEDKIDWAGAESVPYWLRLAKKGEWIYASKSPDGVTWTEVGADRIKMHGKIYLGLAVSSWNNSKLTTSIFDNVSVDSMPGNAVAAISKEE
jgi:hypothetical protein